MSRRVIATPHDARREGLATREDGVVADWTGSATSANHGVGDDAAPIDTDAVQDNFFFRGAG